MRRTAATTLLLAACLLTAHAGHAQEIRRLPPPPELAATVAMADPAELPAPTPAPEPAAEEAPAPELAAPAAASTEPSLEEPPSMEPPVEELSADLIPEIVQPSVPEPEPGPQWYTPTYWFGPTPWDTGVEFGLNGSSGTGDTLSTRAGGYLKRKTDRGKLDTSLYHNRTKSDGEETQNNARLDFRYDWLFGKSPWTLYFNNQSFYDRYQAFDLSMNVNLGVGYQFFDADDVKLALSLGSGAIRKFGGVRDEWVPEAQGGLNWEQKISDSQTFNAKLDYFPEWGDLNSYRLVSDISWQIQLSQPSNTSLKFSLTDRFDSNSDGVNPHNTNYSVLLLWKR